MESNIKNIQKRVSSRKYKNVKFDIEEIENYINKFNNDIFRFKVIETSNKNIKVGTYGMISGANAYITGCIKKEFINDVDTIIQFGYIFEKIVLFITSKNLGTCWLGGTYNAKQVRTTFDVEDNYDVYIVSPIGVIDEKDRVLDKVLNKTIKPRSRKEFGELFFDNGINKSLDEGDEYNVPLNMVRLAPSAKNSQPWIVVKNNDRYDFYGKSKNLNGSRMVGYNDLGIAKCHFELSSIELGLSGRWEKIQSAKKIEQYDYLFSWVTE